MVEVKRENLCSELIKKIVESNLPEDEKLKLIEGVEYEFLIIGRNDVIKPVKKMKFLVLNVLHKLLKTFRRLI
jgi:hypothetical protein